MPPQRLQFMKIIRSGKKKNKCFGQNLYTLLSSLSYTNLSLADLFPFQTGIACPGVSPLGSLVQLQSSVSLHCH